MNPSKVRLGNESFLVFPSGAKTEKSDALLLYKDEVLVFITPSIKEDFKIEAYKNSKPLFEYYSSAIVAAAYLVNKMGLPLREISFEAPNGKIEITDTGSGVFALEIEKCKLLFSKTEDTRGCKIESYTFSFLNEFKVFISKNREFFSLDVLREISFIGDRAAPCIVLFENGEEELLYSPLKEEATSFFASLFRAYFFDENAPLSDGDLSFAFSYNSVAARAKPIIN